MVSALDNFQRWLERKAREDMIFLGACFVVLCLAVSSFLVDVRIFVLWLFGGGAVIWYMYQEDTKKALKQEKERAKEEQDVKGYG